MISGMILMKLIIIAVIDMKTDSENDDRCSGNTACYKTRIIGIRMINN